MNALSNIISFSAVAALIEVQHPSNLKLTLSPLYHGDQWLHISQYRWRKTTTTGVPHLLPCNTLAGVSRVQFSPLIVCSDCHILGIFYFHNGDRAAANYALLVPGSGGAPLRFCSRRVRVYRTCPIDDPFLAGGCFLTVQACDFRGPLLQCVNGGRWGG